MSSANAFNSFGTSIKICCLVKSKDNPYRFRQILDQFTFTFSLLVMTQKAFVDSVDQDHTTKNVQSDL